MQRYLLTRLIQSILLLFGVVVLVFFMVRMTGDAASLLIARDFADPQQLEAMRDALGLNDPLYVQFGNYVTDVLSGEFGYSLRFRQPAIEVILDALPITLLLSGIAMVIALVVWLLVYLYVDRTSAGYELIATGANPRASQVYGINTRWLFLFSLILGGAIAGLSGGIEVAGVHRRLIEGLQSNFLLLGIIIGLIAKGNHLAVPFVAFFIAVLEVGASAMQRTLMIPGEMVFIVEALILLFVLLSDVVGRRYRGR